MERIYRNGSLVALAILSIIMLAFSNILSAQININLAARQSTAFIRVKILSRT